MKQTSQITRNTFSTLANKFVVVLAVAMLFGAAANATPVQPVSFTAMVVNNKVDLKWAMNADSKVSHFIVERSTDGITFHSAAVVFTFEDGTENMGYRFAEKLNSNQSEVYYRISVVSADGAVQISAAQVIHVNHVNEIVLPVNTK